MGAYLSEPITNKETSVEENEEVRVASSSMQGWRVSQEVRTGIFKSYEDKNRFFVKISPSTNASFYLIHVIGCSQCDYQL